MDSVTTFVSMLLVFACVPTYSKFKKYVQNYDLRIRTFKDYPLKYMTKSYFRKSDIKLFKDIQDEIEPPNYAPNEALAISKILNLFEQSHCHVVIDNFQNLDLFEARVSAVQRRLQLAVLEDYYHHIRKLSGSRLLWKPFGIPFGLYNVTRVHVDTRHYKVDCDHNNYFGGALFYILPQLHGYCVGLNFFLYVVKSRPWNCQIHMSLQVYPKVLEVIRHPITFYFDVIPPFDEHFRRMEESMVPKLHIFVQTKELAMPDISLRKFWTTQIPNAITKFMDNTVHPHIFNIVVLLVAFSDNAESPEIMHLISTHFETITSWKLAVQRQRFNFDGLVNLLDSVQQEPEVRMILTEQSYDSASFFQLKRQILKCPTDASPRVTFVKARSSSSIQIVGYDEIFAAGVAPLLISIAANASVGLDWSNRLCRNGKTFINNNIENFDNAQLEITIVNQFHYGPNAYRLNYKEELSKLAFVSCGGGRGNLSTGLDEFVNIYDTSVWVCISLVLVVITWINKRFLTQYRYGRDVISCIIPSIKVLLEQGDPYASSYARSLKPRFSMAALLLAGIVLSNGYKNENVYNMISAKPLIPYTLLSELVEDGFIVLTRILDVIFLTASNHLSHLTSENRSQWARNFSMESNHTVGNYYSVYAKSEVHEWVGHFYKSNEVDILGKLENNTALHNNSTTIMANVFTKNLMELYNPGNATYEDLHAKIVNEIFELQEGELWRHFVSCNKSALVIPSFIAKQYAKALFRNQSYQRIYVGNEDYGNITVGFALQPYSPGFVHPNVIKRMKGLKYSGIWDWWSQFIQANLYFTPELKNAAIQPPTMHGNASLIFYVLFAGIFLSTVLYIVEIRLLIFKFFVFAGIKLKLLLHLIVCFVIATCYKIHFALLKYKFRLYRHD